MIDENELLKSLDLYIEKSQVELTVREKTIIGGIVYLINKQPKISVSKILERIEEIRMEL